MRVLVTGATGFVGRWAVHSLAVAGHEVHGLSRRSRPADGAPVAGWWQGDLLAAGVGESIVRTLRPTHLLHLAWCVEHGRFWQDPANLDWLAASCRLLRAFVAAGGRRMVGVGSCIEYAPQEEPIDEREAALHSPFLYGVAKHAFHLVLAALAGQVGLSQAWARLFYLAGPGEDPARLIPGLAQRLLRRQPALCGSGVQVRDFMDVRDAGRALAELLATEVQGPVNVASGQPRSIASLVRRLEELAGETGLVQLGGRPDRLGEPPFLTAKVERLQREVGFSPEHGLDDMLSTALAWWRQQEPRAAVSS